MRTKLTSSEIENNQQNMVMVNIYGIQIYYKAISKSSILMAHTNYWKSSSSKVLLAKRQRDRLSGVYNALGCLHASRTGKASPNKTPSLGSVSHL